MLASVAERRLSQQAQLVLKLFTKQAINPSRYTCAFQGAHNLLHFQLHQKKRKKTKEEKAQKKEHKGCSRHTG